MPFTNADEVVRYIGGIFETAFATEGIGDKLGATGIVLLVKSTDPESQFTVDMSNRKVLPGMTGPEPSATMTMSADTQNAYWQGNVNLPFAMARGQVKVSGSRRWARHCSRPTSSSSWTTAATTSSSEHRVPAPNVGGSGAAGRWLQPCWNHGIT